MCSLCAGDFFFFFFLNFELKRENVPVSKLAEWIVLLLRYSCWGLYVPLGYNMYSSDKSE